MLDRATATRLARLAVEARVDLRALEDRAAEVVGLLNDWARDGSLDRPSLVLVAANLHGWYTGLETLLERVARLLDGEVPGGPAWHVELLSQAAIAVPGVRPAILPPAVLGDLHELRKFRHFFRNAYGLDLDPGRVRIQAESLARVHPLVATSVGALVSLVDATLASLAPT
jgi:hypothetical protein